MRCLISEFWTQKSPGVYAGLDGVGKFVEAMHAHGFTDSELDMMFKENPAKLPGLASL
jgi:predicted metal-dependent phosphotriesterase family hydrolase